MPVFLKFACKGTTKSEKRKVKSEKLFVNCRKLQKRQLTNRQIITPFCLLFATLILDTARRKIERKTGEKWTWQGVLTDSAGEVGNPRRRSFTFSRAAFGIFACFIGLQNRSKKPLSCSISGLFTDHIAYRKI